MVLGPNQGAFFSPAVPKMLPDLVLGSFLARTKTAMTAVTNMVTSAKLHNFAHVMKTL